MNVSLGWPARECRYCGTRTLIRVASTPACVGCIPHDNPGGARDRAVPAGANTDGGSA